MKKIHLGLLLGFIAGIIDVIPMVVQKLTLDASFSAFTFWIIAGFFISTSDVKLKGAIKGLVIAIILMIPLAILIGWQDPISLVPILIMTIILGPFLGFLIEKFGQ